MSKHKKRISQTEIRLSANMTLVPLSKADTLRDSLSEWRFYGTFSDFETVMPKCAILNRPQRFLFQIINRETEKELWVASQIIYRLPVTTIQNEQEIHPGNLKQFVLKILNEARADACLCHLITLAGPRERDLVLTGISQLRLDHVISPNAMLAILDLLEQYDLAWSPSWFTLSICISGLGNNRLEREWLQLKDWQAWRLWPLLSDTSRIYIEQHGIRPPPVNIFTRDEKRKSPHKGGERVEDRLAEIGQRGLHVASAIEQS